MAPRRFLLIAAAVMLGAGPVRAAAPTVVSRWRSGETIRTRLVYEFQMVHNSATDSATTFERIETVERMTITSVDAGGDATATYGLESLSFVRLEGDRMVRVSVTTPEELAAVTHPAARGLGALVGREVRIRITSDMEIMAVGGLGEVIDAAFAGLTPEQLGMNPREVFSDDAFLRTLNAIYSLYGAGEESPEGAEWSRRFGGRGALISTELMSVWGGRERLNVAYRMGAGGRITLTPSVSDPPQRTAETAEGTTTSFEGFTGSGEVEWDPESGAFRRLQLSCAIHFRHEVSGSGGVRGMLTQAISRELLP